MQTRKLIAGREADDKRGYALIPPTLDTVAATTAATSTAAARESTLEAKDPSQSIADRVVGAIKDTPFKGSLDLTVQLAEAVRSVISMQIASGKLAVGANA